MNTQIVNILKVLQIKMTGTKKGQFVLKGLKFEEKGKSLSLGVLEVVWDYTDADCSFHEGKLDAQGVFNIKLNIRDLKIASPKDQGEFVLTSISLNSVEDIKEFSCLLPLNTLSEMFNKA